LEIWAWFIDVWPRAVGLVYCAYGCLLDPC